jgi:hypothetical protein
MHMNRMADVTRLHGIIVMGLAAALLMAVSCSASSGALTGSSTTQPTTEGSEGPTASACIGARLIALGVVNHSIGLADLTSRYETMNADAAQSSSQAVRDASAALLAAAQKYDATGDQSGFAPALRDMDAACTAAGYPANVR